MTGTIEDLRNEEDGDVHILVKLDDAYRSMLMSANFSIQHGDLVVELMPRDHGHIAEPSIGDRVTIVGAYVDDTEHSWAELHPVWALAANGGSFQRSGPQYGGSPGYARSDNALATCRTSTGAHCVGYGGPVAPEPFSGGGGGSPSPPVSGGNCDPNYSGACLDPNASDYDCAGGSGDGPKYTGEVRVVGTDHYQLDSDGDGLGCE